MKMTKYPFEVPISEVETDPEPFVTAVFSCLESEFLIMPKGPGFVGYPIFERGYEALKQATAAFSNVRPEPILRVVFEHSISIVVLRTMLGFTPPEWAYVAAQRTGLRVTQGFVRSLDRKVRMAPTVPIQNKGVTAERIKALVDTACELLNDGVPTVGFDKVHRLDKADTRSGAEGLRASASLGVPYAMLLCERFLGRPFAGHRDSASELVGDTLELAIEDVLTDAGISYRKTKRAESIPGFDQTPDFIIPSEFNPQAVIEAKITEDDGTARDKVTRIQHFAELSLLGQRPGEPKFEVIACIAGRGFGVRREDMKKLLLATRGKVFTLQNLGKLIECTRLKEFAITR